MEDGETRQLLITAYRFEEVQFPEYSDAAWTVTIPPRRFRAMRIEIAEENGRPLRRHYWIDSLRLIYVLSPKLSRPGGVPNSYQITKHGIPPKSWYEVKP